MAYGFNEDKSKVQVPTTSEMQTALNSKQNTITGAAQTVTDNNLSANKVLISDTNGKIAESSVNSTELGYVQGVTGSIQQQLNAKTTLNQVLNALYPIGCVYFANGTTTPTVGTWSRIGNLTLEYGGVAYNVAAFKRLA